jgi:hypothetical protein
LSILKLSEINGMLVLNLKTNGISFRNINLYIISILKNPLETIAHVFDNRFDILGTENVNNEDSPPIKYITIHTIKQIIILFAVMNKKPPTKAIKFLSSTAYIILPHSVIVK